MLAPLQDGGGVADNSAKQAQLPCTRKKPRKAKKQPAVVAMKPKNANQLMLLPHMRKAKNSHESHMGPITAACAALQTVYADQVKEQKRNLLLRYMQGIKEENDISVIEQTVYSNHFIKWARQSNVKMCIDNERPIAFVREWSQFNVKHALEWHKAEAEKDQSIYGLLVLGKCGALSAESEEFKQQVSCECKSGLKRAEENVDLVVKDVVNELLAFVQFEEDIANPAKCERLRYPSDGRKEFVKASLDYGEKGETARNLSMSLKGGKFFVPELYNDGCYHCPTDPTRDERLINRLNNNLDKAGFRKDASVGNIYHTGTFAFKRWEVDLCKFLEHMEHVDMYEKQRETSEQMVLMDA